MFQLNKELPSLTRVSVYDIDYWFSYDTCIAFTLDNKNYLSENIWSPSTNKHLIHIDKDAKRYDNKVFNKMLNDLHEGECMEEHF